MNAIRIFLSRLRGTFGGPGSDRQLTDEMAAHLDMLAEDLPTVVGVCVVLTAAGWLAAYVPARRASRVDPLVALRCE